MEFSKKNTWKRPQISMFNSNSLHRESLLLLLYGSTQAQGKDGGCAQGAHTKPHTPPYPVSGHLAWAGFATSSLLLIFEHRQGGELTGGGGRDRQTDRLESVMTSWNCICWTLLQDSPDRLSCQENLPLPFWLKSAWQSLQNGVRWECHIHKNLPLEL